MNEKQYKAEADSLLDELVQLIEMDDDTGTVITTRECNRLIENALASAFALGAASAGGEVERLREACEGLLASIRSRYPNDFMPGGKGYVCPHHRAIAAALATDASGALTSALRAKWEVLRGECEAVRELGDWSANTHNPRSSEVESTMLRLLGEVIAARTLTDSTHALEEE